MQTTHPEACASNAYTVVYLMPKVSSSNRNRVMRLVRKFNLIQKAGGSCVVCGYKKNISSLAFHHINKKGANLSGAHLLSMSILGAEEEISKCVLVCHNCHNEIHNPELGLKEISSMYKSIKQNKLTYSQAHLKFLGKKS
jgi:5-methylcytosine-specific restriction endonuclease McrA